MNRVKISYKTLKIVYIAIKTKECEKKMIELIIPPISDCFMPTLGVAQIAGYLYENNIDCMVYDASAELMFEIFNIVNNLPPHIRDIIWDDHTYSFKNIVAAMNYISLKDGNFKITPDNFCTNFNWRDFEATQRFIHSNTIFHNLVKTLPSVRNNKKPGTIVGFSISYESQVLPAFILADNIKKQYPYVKICIGGSLLYNYSEYFYNIMYISDLIDYLIIGAGEIALEHIALGCLNKLQQMDGIEIVDVLGKYIIDTRQFTGHPIVYAPDFSNFNFDLYPTKAKAFPYMIKDKCYYGKCYFCNGDKVLLHNNKKQVLDAFGQIEIISATTGISNVYLVDAALSPKDFEQIGRMNLKNNIRWIANARFEKQFLEETLIQQIAANGCDMLRFGLESASQHVLNLMNKGTIIENAEKIIQLTDKYKIKNHLYIMFGYPGETADDRRLTLDFLNRNKEYIYSYSVSVFQPIPGTYIYEKLAKEIANKDHEYERILELIYPDEDDYQLLYNDIMTVSSILDGFAHTNLEFYSANIFNDMYSNYENIQVTPSKLENPNSLLASLAVSIIELDSICVTEINCDRVHELWHIDFYHNRLIKCFISETLADSFNSTLDSDCTDKKQELINILRNFNTDTTYLYFSINSDERDISKEMSIQFLP